MLADASATGVVHGSVPANRTAGHGRQKPLQRPCHARFVGIARPARVLTLHNRAGIAFASCLVMESGCVHSDVGSVPGGRLNVLLTEADDLWAEQLPRLLEPQGVRTIRVVSVDQAVEVIEHVPIHAAVVGIGAGKMDGNRLPERAEGLLAQKSSVPFSGPTAGLKLLRIIRRLHPTPPAVVVRGRLFDRRSDERLLSEALKLEAFSVLDQPVELEQLLETLRRLLQRYYGGVWPKAD